LSKTTAILGGAYGTLVIILVFIFLFSPGKFDILNQASHTNSNFLDQLNPKNHELSLADIFAKSDDGVVQIIVRKSNDSSTERDIGSGIVYDASGHIITNNHVVESAQKISVVFHSGKSYNANVVGTDPYADLAVVKVDADASALYPLSLGNSADLRIGDEVAAIGNPFGLSGSMTQGIVSQLGRLLNPPDSSFSIPNVIQTDTPINPGNSGGPLLNMQGEVIGITTAIQSGTGEFSGVGFAIPSNTMKKIVPVLIETGHYKHPWLGISGVSIDFDLASTLQLPVSSGFLIEGVVPNSPAAIAGLHGATENKTIDGTKYEIGGDIVTGVDENPIKQIEDILDYLQDNKNVGDKITLEIIRDGKKMDVSLTLQERPAQT
jgi:S1-C subfamily serine protease